MRTRRAARDPDRDTADASAREDAGAQTRAAPPRIQHRNLPQLLLQARGRLMSHFRPVLNRHGVTEQQWRIVRTLMERGPLEPRQLGELCQISSPSLAGVLQRMDELGLVRRHAVPEDQRRVRVEPTARSRGLAARMADEIEAAYQRIEATIGADLARRLYAVLDEAIAKLPEG